jgi:hypothetical protein
MRQFSLVDGPVLAPALERADPEARAAYLLLVVVGGLRLIVAFALGEALAGEATVALAMTVGGAVGLARGR